MKLLLIITSLSFAACGQQQSCLTHPVTCSTAERYGSQCLRYQDYKSAGYNMTEANTACGMFTAPKPDYGPIQ